MDSESASILSILIGAFTLLWAFWLYLPYKLIIAPVLAIITILLALVARPKATDNKWKVGLVMGLISLIWLIITMASLSWP